MDKPVKTNEDYIEELEMRFEESADMWNLTSWQIYGPNGYIVQLSALKNELKAVKAELFLIKKFLEKSKRKTNEKFD